MTTGETQSEDAFLASKRATWNSFLWLCGGTSVAVVLILVVLALVFVV